MDPYQEFTPQQYRKFNGQSIMMALDAMGGSATADHLAEHIGNMIDQPQHLVKPEVSQVLRRGISNGFFQRRGKEYFLFNKDRTYEVDGKKRKRKIINLPFELQTDGRRKIIRLSRNSDDEDSDSKLDLKEQTIDGLQEIIAKANEDTRKATILATKAAKRAKLASTKIQEIVDSGGDERDD